MSNKRAIKLQTKTIVVAGKTFKLYSLDGDTWSSDPEEPMRILTRQEEGRIQLQAKVQPASSQQREASGEKEQRYDPEFGSEKGRGGAGKRFSDSASLDDDEDDDDLEYDVDDEEDSDDDEGLDDEDDGFDDEEKDYSPPVKKAAGRSKDQQAKAKVDKVTSTPKADKSGSAKKVSGNKKEKKSLEKTTSAPKVGVSKENKKSKITAKSSPKSKIKK